METEQYKTVQGFSAALTSGDRAKGKHLDTMRALGMRYTDCISPVSKDSAESTATEDSWGSLKDAVRAGFPKSDERLFLVDVKSLSDAEKAQKRWVTQQVGSRIKDIKNGLKTRAISAGEIEKSAKVIKSGAEKIRAQLMTIIKISKNDEKPEYSSVELNNAAATMMLIVGTPEDVQKMLDQ